MRFTAILLAALLMIAVVLALPAKEKPAKKACARSCTFDYTPVCGGVKDSKDKPISFGNTCVLENYNCENQKSLVVLSQGECPGGGGVRLQ
ncbi:turripeptide Pal9.2-like [Toxorhynchites rutilus septentrionalis]|uniref:turripeptide Pal9.2-like n=1 Tax=Toxorhynchites rutilus septentrionalis TaxID=329112 RepID=UPI00247AE69C|nr:turripeptide Pal9.2-like [Toxorhynchites rutilus septentrionalis]